MSSRKSKYFHARRSVEDYFLDRASGEHKAKNSEELPDRPKEADELTQAKILPAEGKLPVRSFRALEEEIESRPEQKDQRAKFFGERKRGRGGE